MIDSISDEIDKAFSLHPFTNILVFGDFSAHYVNCLNHSAPDVAGSQTLNFCITQSLTQLADSPSHLLHFFSNPNERASLVDLFFTTTPTHVLLCSSVLLANSIISLSAPLSVNNLLPREYLSVTFTLIGDSFCDYLRDVPGNVVFNYSIVLPDPFKQKREFHKALFCF